MPEQTDLWFRDRSRKSNKWHRLFRVDMGNGQHVDDTPCGLQVGPPVMDDIVTRVPVGQAPDDEFGVCLHCLRYSEMERRLAEKERRKGDIDEPA